MSAECRIYRRRTDYLAEIVGFHSLDTVNAMNDEMNAAIDGNLRSIFSERRRFQHAAVITVHEVCFDFLDRDRVDGARFCIEINRQ